MEFQRIFRYLGTDVSITVDGICVCSGPISSFIANIVKHSKKQNISEHTLNPVNIICLFNVILSYCVKI